MTGTLAREIQQGQVAHAYLFAGPRGTGKTTTARILAKALNCSRRDESGEPCNACDSCLAVTEAQSLDVIELDAASHNKVEDIREIRVNVSTVASVSGAKRIYILDEAHMLSKAAGNALLKTLEEPPEHVHFVLATTEPYKLLDTVRSRAQRFNFHPVSAEILAGYLDRIASREGFEASQESLLAIARQARGAVRDALSLLEQVAALGSGVVEVAGVNRALGLAEPAALEHLVTALAHQDARAVLELVARLAAEGVDLRRFVSESAGFFRGVFLALYAPNLEEIVDEPYDTLEEWRRAARQLSAADVLRAVDHLGEALVQLREGREERLVVELALLKLVRPETALDPASLAARIDRVEERLRRLGELAVTAPVEEPKQEPPGPVLDLRTSGDGGNGSVSEEPSLTQTESRPAPSISEEQLEATWPALVAAVRDQAGPRRHALFREVTPGEVEGATIVLRVPDHLPFHLEQLRADDRLRHIVESAAAELLGPGLEVEYRVADGEIEPADADDEVPDKDRLEEAHEHEHDPETLVADLLGGQVVEDS